MPRVPGLPEENYGVTNLFDVVIPDVDLDASEAWQIAQEGLHCVLKQTGKSRGRGDFSLKGGDMTVGEILAAYAEFCGAGVEVDPVHYTILLDSSSPLERAWQGVERLF